jgi:predicted dehydrogenase
MTAPEPIRWGIVATGFIANQFVEDLRSLPDATVTAVCSRSHETATAFAARHHIAHVHHDLADLARDPDVDVVYVASPHAAHHAATRLLLDAGKAVLCEKPLTLDLASAEDLVQLARTRGVFLMEAMWMLTNPTVRRCRELVADGAIGEVTHVTADFGVAGPFPVGHRLRAPALGGGALLDLGVYPVALAHYFLGRPESITAWARLLPEGTDENTALILGYGTGAVATLHAGMVGDTGQRAVVTGTAGRIEIDRYFWKPTGCTLHRSNGASERIELPVRGHGMVYEAEEVMRCLRAGLIESPLIPHEATLGVMATLDTALRQVGVTYPASEVTGSPLIHSQAESGDRS